MPENTRTEAKREADRVEIARRYLRGETQQAIADAIGVSRQQVGYDLRIIRGRWLEASLMAFDQRVAQELAKIDQLEATYWEAWDRSMQPREETTTKRIDAEKARAEAGVKRFARDGNPQFLTGVMSCIDRRVRLLGLDKPVKVDVEGLLRAEAKRAGLSEEEAVAAAEAIVREMAAGQ